MIKLSIFRHSTALLLFLFATHVQAIEPAPATPANDFLNSIGINSSLNTRGENVETTIQTCKYLGIRWIRTGPPDNPPGYWHNNNIEVYKRLYNEGFRFSFILSSEGDAYIGDDGRGPIDGGIPYTMEGAKRVIGETGPDALIAFEGPNEPNNWPVTYKGEKGGGSGDWKPLAEYQRDFYAALKADNLLKNYPVWSPSDMGAQQNNVGLQFLTIPEGADTLMPAGTQYADYACIHNYFVHNCWPARSNNQTWLAADPVTTNCLNSLRGNFGITWYKHFQGYTDQQLLTLPRVTTETGVTVTHPYIWDWTWIDGKGYVGWSEQVPNPDYTNPERKITEEEQGLMYLSCYLAQFKQGFKYTSMYILRDRIDEGDNQTFGFYESHRDDKLNGYTSNPRKAAHYLHNMTTILADNQSVESPGTLAYSISPLPETVHDLLLQKSDGKMFLVIWGEKYAYGAAAENVTVTFNQAYPEIKIYNPARYDASDPEKGTRPLRTESNVNAITLAMLNHPYILEITGASQQDEKLPAVLTEISM